MDAEVIRTQENRKNIKAKKIAKRKWISVIKKNKLYYLLIIPGILYFIIFHYGPMFGIIIAFKDVAPFEGIKGIIHGPWVGFKHFKTFFQSYYFWNVLGNTVIISAYRIIFGFPAPIILALLLNEVKNEKFKRTVQTISYLPHFISMVVLAGLVMFFAREKSSILQKFFPRHQWGIFMLTT